jgi:hypothetical protein
MRQVDAGRVPHLRMNQQITQGYMQFAREVQYIVEPGFNGQSTSAIPNWFGFAPHASNAAGHGMRAAEAGLSILNRDIIPNNLYDWSEALGLQGRVRQAVDLIQRALELARVPPEVAYALAAVLAGSNVDAMLDRNTARITLERMVRLYLRAPGSNPVEKAKTVLRTLDNLLAEGNRDIYRDVGGTAQRYLQFRHQTGGRPVAPARVLSCFRLEHSTPDQARRVYDFAMREISQGREPINFDRLFPGANGLNNMSVAAYALYETAGQRPRQDSVNRDKLVRFANNLMAYREQHDAVQPAFTPPRCVMNEVNRSELMYAMTPLTQLPLGGGATWRYTEFADKQRDRDGNPNTPQETERNWARFEDRWPAILSAFAQGYRNPRALWQFPNVNAPLPLPGARPRVA